MAQLIEGLLPTPQNRGSNPDIGKINLLSITYIIIQKLERKDGNKEKEAGNGPFLKELYTPRV